MFLRKPILIILLSAALMSSLTGCSGTKQNGENVADGEKNSEAYFHPITDQEIQKELEFIFGFHKAPSSSRKRELCQSLLFEHNGYL